MSNDPPSHMLVWSMKWEAMNQLKVNLATNSVMQY